VRRPQLLCHPDSGYVLLWEDDLQNGHFDLYCAFLDSNGQVDSRLAAAADDVLSRRLLRLSDTPGDMRRIRRRRRRRGFFADLPKPG
jgi:hypothetical protein